MMMVAFIPLALAFSPTSWSGFHTAATLRTAATPVVMSLPSDADLFASLSARIAKADEGGVQPLGPDDVTADKMCPKDVVMYCMRSLREGTDDGMRALLGFAVRVDDGSKCEDMLGQLQPGYYTDPADLRAFLEEHPRYRTLVSLSEFKCMGPPELSDVSRRAAQKLLVRRDGKNWEDLFINMRLAEMQQNEKDPETGAPAPRRWLITSIYKQQDSA